jgi:RNA polymerase sigma-70 factor (ECF subfamily)
MKGWLFTILRNTWLNQLRKVRNGPQIVEMDAKNGVANSVVEPSKNSHDLYVNKMEIEQVRAAFQALPVESRRSSCCENMKICHIRRSRWCWTVLSEP